MSEQSFDIAVIGGGPGGYVAAIRASQLGMKACVIEREHLGGVCLNWGCIPTKALLRSSELWHLMNRAAEFGLSADNLRFDLAKMVERSRSVAERLTSGVAFLMKKNKVTVIEGEGRLAGKGKIAVKGRDGETIVSATRVIVATGARARTLPHLSPDGKRIWTYREALLPDAMPKSLLVVGSGAIGIEFASFFRTLGAEVTVVEIMDRILPVEDAEISALAKTAFEKQGMTILTGASVEMLDASGDRVKAAIRMGGATEERNFDRVILAIGIAGNVENLGLEEAGVKIEKGHVVVDEWMRTGVDGLYAIGDVVGAPWLAHKASHEGVLCVEKIAGVDGVHPLDVRHVPGCTYCWPQVASIGLTEDVANGAGRELKVGRFPYRANGKAIAMGDTDGMVKTIFDARTGELLGAHIFGAEATELIQGFAVGKVCEATETEFMRTIFPHPTLSEMMHESVLDAYGRVVHA
jgi:dihydrolipoamide dehydrogenase